MPIFIIGGGQRADHALRLGNHRHREPGPTGTDLGEGPGVVRLDHERGQTLVDAVRELAGVRRRTR